jgi:Bacteriophage baseplate protein W
MAGFAQNRGFADGWAHVQQSIGKILTTPLNTRVMRRDFGSELPDLIDRPMTDRVVMALFAAVAIALEPRRVDGNWYGEPRFRLNRVEVLETSVEGRLALALWGTYFPKGHLDDFSISEADMALQVVT